MPNSQTPSVQQLQRAVEIAEEIESLQRELTSILQGGASPAATLPLPDTKPGNAEAVGSRKYGGKRKKKRTMSPEARERIAAAQRARWAKQRAS